uniref:DUF8003 domain-containing protein n=1 Tax=Oryza meridionalis TaxID=40149 RepID=A0A0E0DMX3_9ORYZ
MVYPSSTNQKRHCPSGPTKPQHSSQSPPLPESQGKSDGLSPTAPLRFPFATEAETEQPPPNPNPPLAVSGDLRRRRRRRRQSETSSSSPTYPPGAGSSDASHPMATHIPLARLRLRLPHLALLALLAVASGNPSLGGFDRGDAEAEAYSILTFHDYTPPPPPSLPPPPPAPSATCAGDLRGVGDLDTRCVVPASVRLRGPGVYISGNGTLVLVDGVALTCERPGCVVSANLSGGIFFGREARVVAGWVSLSAANITLSSDAVIDTTALAGDPPDKTSGVPTGSYGDGGGHGGRGASCYVKEGQAQEDSWGGDMYAWAELKTPNSYGSKGGSTSVEKDYGGGGGGVVWLFAKDIMMNGTILANGGDGGTKGGGGSGGSIYLKAKTMQGGGTISACGGDGLAGGGGGRVSVDVFSRHDDSQFFVHGGRSSGCLDNAGAAGTLYEEVPKSITVSNNNLSTQTDTVFLEPPYDPLWTNVFIKNHAKVSLPLRWSRIQAQGQISLLSRATLTFGLTHYPYSEFELLAEELLMSDSTIKVFGALRMSVKMLLMWNSRMLIDGGRESGVATSLLEGSNLIVLKESSVIHSIGNLGIHGQGILNLSGDGDTIQAQRLILSLFYNIVICRVEDIVVSGLVQGTVINFNRARNVTVRSSGTISATGLALVGLEVMVVAEVEVAGFTSTGLTFPLEMIIFPLQRGGTVDGQGFPGENGTVTGKDCPKGLYGTFCKACPLGTYKNITGSLKSLCSPCPTNELPHRAVYISIRGGVTETPCPYKCVSDRYRMPHCFTALEELIYTFGGPWLFGLFLSGLLFLLALVLSIARMKFVGTDELPGPAPTQHSSQIDHSFPFLESLNEVLETNRAEESHCHVHRMYFMGPNTFSEPWHLPHTPPEQIFEIVYEDAFNKFVDEINALAAYQWWEGSIYSILCILSYPLAWSWQQWRRRRKLQRLREFVRSEYDHSCLRSCRSRALYEGLKVAATPDLMLAYLDFFLGGDEKRPDLPPRLHQRLPMSLIFGGDGSYMAPFSLHSDSVVTSLISQGVPSSIWHRLVAGLNAQLRLARRGNLKATFLPVLKWLETHANPALNTYRVRVDLAWFQATALGYYQFGLVIHSVGPFSSGLQGGSRMKFDYHAQFQNTNVDSQLDHSRNNDAVMLKRITGRVLDIDNLRTLKDKRDLFYPLSLILNNTKPVGHQDLVGLVISILLLADFSLVLLTFLQLYSYSMIDVLLVLFVLPLGILAPFPAGINALFSHGPRRSAGLARVYALWNITSLIVAFACGLVHYKSSAKRHPSMQPWNLGGDDTSWWLFPTGLVLCKCIQARLVDWHVSILEIQDRAVYSNDPTIFWQ